MTGTERVNLGDRVRDTISGWTGIANARTEWLYGCVRIFVTPEKIGKDGKAIEGQTFDEPQLEILKLKKVPNPNRGTAGGRNDYLALKKY